MVLNLSVIVVRWTHAAQSSGQWGVFLSDRGYCDVTPHLPYLAEIDDGDLFTVWAGSYVFCNIRGAKAAKIGRDPDILFSAASNECSVMDFVLWKIQTDKDNEDQRKS